MNPTLAAHDILQTRTCIQGGCTDDASKGSDYCKAHRQIKPVKKLNLEELIDHQIELGHKDPHTFPDLLKKSLGRDLLAIIEPYLDDFISEMGRQRLSSLRRRSVAKITGGHLGDPEIMIRSMWVPTGDQTITYKPIGEMTAEDFDSRAVYLEHMSTGIRVSAQWCRNVATQMRAEGAQTAKNLSALPPLPDLEDL